MFKASNHFEISDYKKGSYISRNNIKLQPVSITRSQKRKQLFSKSINFFTEVWVEDNVGNLLNEDQEIR